MLCGIRQNAFLISMPYNMGEMTLKDVFKSSEGDDKNIFQEKIREKMLEQGVTLIAPETVYFSHYTKFFLLQLKCIMLHFMVGFMICQHLTHLVF